MKINFEFDDDNAVFEILDAAFVAMLKRELKSTYEFLENDGWKHPDDVVQWEKNVAALNVLIRYYGGERDEQTN